MAYGYKFKLPVSLSDPQRKQLRDLAESTARKASVVDTGTFRKGWKASINANVLSVMNNTAYAAIVEEGRGYNRHNRFRVRDALFRIGFETYFDGPLGPTPTSDTADADTPASPKAPSEPSRPSNTAQLPSADTVADLGQLTTPSALTEISAPISIPTIQDLPTLPTAGDIIPPTIPLPSDKVNYMNYLLAIIAANELLNQEEENTDEQDIEN